MTTEGDAVSTEGDAMTTDAAVVEAVPQPPALRVISGNATAEEVAALVAVLSAASAGGAEEATPRRSLWTDSARVPGARLAPGPGAWRASALPR